MTSANVTAWSHAALRIVAGFLFFQHGYPKLFGTLPGSAEVEVPRELLSIFWWSGFLEVVGGFLIMIGLFTVTGWLILLLAAGMAAQAAAYLVQADILPPLGETIWDTSKLLPDNSILGKLMHTLVGYTARPYGIQLGFYTFTLVVILVLMRLFAKDPRTGPRQSPA